MENRSAAEYVKRNVRQLRTDKGWRLVDLSERLTEVEHPMAVNTLSRVENGERGVDVDDLVALAEALDVTPDRLLTDPHRVEQQPVLELVNAWRMALMDRNTATRRIDEITGQMSELAITDELREGIWAWLPAFLEANQAWHDETTPAMLQALGIRPAWRATKKPGTRKKGKS